MQENNLREVFDLSFRWQQHAEGGWIPIHFHTIRIPEAIVQDRGVI